MSVVKEVEPRLVLPAPAPGLPNLWRDRVPVGAARGRQDGQVSGPGDAEVERGHGRRSDGHGGRDGVLEEGEGVRGPVAGAVGGG
jgi:hypothetical protein